MTTGRHVVVVAAGELELDTDGHRQRVLAAVDGASLVIAADGGLNHAERLGLAVDVAVGDFDSASADARARAEASGATFDSHRADKDETDLELALALAVSEGPTRLTVVGALGGRLDHELANVGLLASEDLAGCQVVAVDARRTVAVVRPDRPVEVSFPPGATVSLVPWTEQVEGVRTNGLRWALNDETLERRRARGVSNVAETDRQQVTIRTGVLLLIVDTLEDDTVED